MQIFVVWLAVLLVIGQSGEAAVAVLLPAVLLPAAHLPDHEAAISWLSHLSSFSVAGGEPVTLSGILNNALSTVDQFLNENPDLKLSGSAFTSKVINSQFDTVNAYLDANPKLKLPMSIYVADVWGSQLGSLVDYLARSPLAKNTNEFITATKAASIQSAEFQYDSTGLPTNPVTSFTADLGKSIRTGFDGILDANPKLRLSTSEATMDFYNTVFLPKATSIIAFLDRSPIAQSTREVLDAPSSEIISKV